MTEQLTLVATHCCKHCARLPDGGCAWLTARHLAAHISTCFECGPRHVPVTTPDAQPNPIEGAPHVRLG